MFGQDREQLRQFYFEVWRKKRLPAASQPLEPLEQLVASVIEQHPEYHALLEQPANSTDADSVSALHRDYAPDDGQTNPFLHMGMHIALHEQLLSDRPAGIRPLYQRLCQLSGDIHRAEHRMLDVLGETLWEAQRSGQAPDETDYLRRLQALAK